MAYSPTPSRPILYVNQTGDAEKVRGMLRAYDIDFEERPTTGPFVSLHWNGIVYTDVFGIADFLDVRGTAADRRGPHRRAAKRRQASWVPDIAAIALAGLWELPPSITQRSPWRPSEVAGLRHGPKTRWDQ